MSSDDSSADRQLPTARPPFQVGERVAFFPAVLGPAANWLRWDFAVIDDINEAAETFGFHFVGEPGVRHAQGLEKIVRPTPAYEAWRVAWDKAFGRSQDEGIALAETKELWLRVLAEHPIHGSKDEIDRHAALPPIRR
jgi:hypothetical protein